MKNIKFILVILSFSIVSTSCRSTKSTAVTISPKLKIESQFRYYKGTKYKYGGTTKDGFDCSGFAQKVFQNAFKLALPRTTKEMSKLGKKVSKNKLIPGDLVFFRPSRTYQHVGIYIGENSFIHSSTSKGVIKSKLDNPYWKKKYKFAKRILKKP